MKKLLILLLAAGLFTSCNNNKGKNDRTDRDTTKTSKDDYNSGDKSSDKDKDKDKDNTDQNKDNNGNTNNNSRGSWSSVEVDAFITNCVSSAVNGGMQRTKADSYCNCMQRKLETLYPNVNDAGSLTEEDMNSPSMQRLVKDCLF